LSQKQHRLPAGVLYNAQISHVRHTGVCCLLRRNLATPRLRSPSDSHSFFSKMNEAGFTHDSQLSYRRTKSVDMFPLGFTETANQTITVVNMEAAHLDTESPQAPSGPPEVSGGQKPDRDYPTPLFRSHSIRFLLEPRDDALLPHKSSDRAIPQHVWRLSPEGASYPAGLVSIVIKLRGVNEQANASRSGTTSGSPRQTPQLFASQPSSPARFES
jgi:hypothetical protein